MWGSQQAGSESKIGYSPLRTQAGCSSCDSDSRFLLFRTRTLGAPKLLVAGSGLGLVIVLRLVIGLFSEDVVILAVLGSEVGEVVVVADIAEAG